jgi:hypothetical protein
MLRFFVCIFGIHRGDARKCGAPPELLLKFVECVFVALGFEFDVAVVGVSHPAVQEVILGGLENPIAKAYALNAAFYCCP